MRENDRQTRQTAEAQSMHHWRYKVGMRYGKWTKVPAKSEQCV